MAVNGRWLTTRRLTAPCVSTYSTHDSCRVDAPRSAMVSRAPLHMPRGTVVDDRSCRAGHTDARGRQGSRAHAPRMAGAPRPVHEAGAAGGNGRRFAGGPSSAREGRGRSPREAAQRPLRARRCARCGRSCRVCIVEGPLCEPVSLLLRELGGSDRCRHLRCALHGDVVCVKPYRHAPAAGLLCPLTNAGRAGPRSVVLAWRSVGEHQAQGSVSVRHDRLPRGNRPSLIAAVVWAVLDARWCVFLVKAACATARWADEPTGRATNRDSRAGRHRGPGCARQARRVQPWLSGQRSVLSEPDAVQRVVRALVTSVFRCRRQRRFRVVPADLRSLPVHRTVPRVLAGLSRSTRSSRDPYLAGETVLIAREAEVPSGPNREDVRRGRRCPRVPMTRGRTSAGTSEDAASPARGSFRRP